MNTSPFSNTPSVTVTSNRGFTVRDIAYHRHPASPSVTHVRVTRYQHDARGFLMQSADPRLLGAGRVNFSYLTGLAGSVLRTQGADNGTTVSLNDAAGRLLISVSNISMADDGTENRHQAVTRSLQYEEATLPGRPVSLTEQLSGETARITERFVYAGSAAEEKAMNLAGACVSHYDTAGLVQTDSIALTGAPLCVTRRLLKEADNPDVVADWQGDDASAWNDLLTREGEEYTILTTADAGGAVLTTTDAKGNMQRVAYNVAGLLSGRSCVKSAAITLVATYMPEAKTQRLTGIPSEAGYTCGVKVLQDLRHKDDPMGNVLKITNDAEETRLWRNQHTEAVPENMHTFTVWLLSSIDSGVSGDPRAGFQTASGAARGREFP